MLIILVETKLTLLPLEFSPVNIPNLKDSSVFHCSINVSGTTIKAFLFSLSDKKIFKTEIASIVFPSPTSSANIYLQFLSCKQRITVFI